MDPKLADQQPAEPGAVWASEQLDRPVFSHRLCRWLQQRHQRVAKHFL